VLAGPWLLRVLADSQIAAAAGKAENVREVGGAALLLLFAVPAALAFFDHLRRSWERRGSGTRWEQAKNLARVGYDPTYPTAWDAAFDDRTWCFVRVLTKDGNWVGGWYGEESWSTSYPEPNEIYLQAAYLLTSEGIFSAAMAPNSGGIYVRCDDARLVEFVDAPPPLASPPGTGAPAPGPTPTS